MIERGGEGRCLSSPGMIERGTEGRYLSSFCPEHEFAKGRGRSGKLKGLIRGLFNKGDTFTCVKSRVIAVVPAVTVPVPAR